METLMCVYFYLLPQEGALWGPGDPRGARQRGQTQTPNEKDPACFTRERVHGAQEGHTEPPRGCGAGAAVGVCHQKTPTCTTTLGGRVKHISHGKFCILVKTHLYHRMDS